jgi:hypothetical protein
MRLQQLSEQTARPHWRQFGELVLLHVDDDESS